MPNPQLVTFDVQNQNRGTMCVEMAGTRADLQLVQPTLVSDANLLQTHAIRLVAWLLSLHTCNPVTEHTKTTRSIPKLD